ncbi:TolB family protein [Coleofasciculus sp. LEGE 07092]|uniref:TolB family protein n=1 Tax=Coleofasciculus sp. LEGE 07092 TaxID=2777969 RepID=UPI002AD1E348|nr:MULTISPECIES: biopolymer transporter Tol [unclassified Coleofasciculus]
MSARQQRAKRLLWGIVLILTGLIVACSPPVNSQIEPTTLNSRYTEEQPALSGNGRFLAFVSNRGGTRQILMYDLQQQQLVDLPSLNRRNAIAESPSLSYTGRYIAYIANERGTPVIELYDQATQRSQILPLGYRRGVRNPSISPDGRTIVFETSRRGQWDIEVLDRGFDVELDIPDGSPVSQE